MRLPVDGSRQRLEGALGRQPERVEVVLGLGAPVVERRHALGQVDLMLACPVIPERRAQ
ncbi:hypothetical protein D3C80_1681250 [compost metagenome]